MHDSKELTWLHEARPAVSLAAVATIGGNVRLLRERAGFEKATDFARVAMMPPSQLSDIEADRYVPGLPVLRRLAVVAGCDVADLLADTEYAQRSTNADNGTTNVEDDRVDVSGHTRDDIPVIAEGEASPQGNLFWDDEGKLVSDVEDRISRPFDVNDPRAYGLRFRGDSMMRFYKPGDLVVVSPNTPVANGDEAYVQLLDGRRLIKVVRRVPEGVVLESYNPAYEPLFVRAELIGAMHPIVWSKRKASGTRIVKPEGRRP